MIIDNLSMLCKYTGVCEKLSVVCEFLSENSLADLECKRYDLKDGVFLNVSEYEPYAAGDKWETHKKYADLQIVVEGSEKMDGASLCEVKGPNGYNAEDDFEFYDVCEGTVTTICAVPGTFAFFAPGDPHRPGIKLDSPKVKKAVFKIPV